MGSLRRRTLSMVAAILACSVVAGYFLSQWVMDKSFREFESRDALQALERGRILMAEQIAGARQQVQDYGFWTVTYNFMVDRDPAYVSDNYSTDSMRNLQTDFVALLDTDFEVAMALADPQSLGQAGDSLVEWQGPLRDRVLGDPLIRQLVKGADTSSTLMFLHGEPYVIGVSSVLDSHSEGPSRGALIFVRHLNPRQIQHLQKLTQSGFVLAPFQSGAAQGTVHFHDNGITASLPLADQAGTPIAVLTSSGPRALSAQSTTLRRIVLFNSLGMTLIALPLAFLIFDRMVLAKVSALVEEIARVRQFPDAARRLPEHGDGDLDRISSEVNRLLEEVAVSHGKLRHDALHDSLTGLGNRQLLLDSLALAQARLASGKLSRFALLLLDLDGFKDINDLYGHSAGDQVLSTLANRLTAGLRGGDMAVRLGGDEFALLTEPASGDNLDHLAQRILALVAQPLDCDGRPLEVRSSLGILDVQSAEGNDAPEDLLRKADIAMYAAKQSGRNGYRYFNEAMQKGLSERKALEDDLRAALDRDVLEVWYQPLFDTRTNSMVGVEALSRWPHPERGLIAADMFVPMAEELRIVSRLDLAVLRKACHFLERLRARDLDLTVSVNLSVLTLVLPNLTTLVADLLVEHRLPGSALLFEVTETALARNERDLRDPMTTLRALGIRFQIDDFGTGYSSLSRLHLLPLDIVKIDSSFVAKLDEGDERMCQAIIRLAHHLEMQVVAEGVETAAQRDSLVRIGCDQIQGFYCGRPVPGDALLSQAAALRVWQAS